MTHEKYVLKLRIKDPKLHILNCHNNLLLSTPSHDQKLTLRQMCIITIIIMAFNLKKLKTLSQKWMLSTHLHSSAGSGGGLGGSGWNCPAQPLNHSWELIDTSAWYYATLISSSNCLFVAIATLLLVLLLSLSNYLPILICSCLCISVHHWLLLWSATVDPQKGECMCGCRCL